MHTIKSVHYIEGYKLKLTFNDKKTVVVDLEKYLDKGIFLTLRDVNYFKKVFITGGTIAWPNEADFCPDVLYDIDEEKKKSIVRRRTTTHSRKRKRKVDIHGR